jgi:hypothetical protein
MRCTHTQNLVILAIRGDMAIRRYGPLYAFQDGRHIENASVILKQNSRQSAILYLISTNIELV